MKLIIAVFALIYFSSVLTCSRGSEIVLSNSDTTQVKVLQCINIIKNNTNIQVCLDSVMDSRCPADATCIWQGVGITKLRCTINNQLYQFKLSTTKFEAINTDTIIQGFNIKLIELMPYPFVNNPQPYGNYQAKILVTY